MQHATCNMQHATCNMQHRCLQLYVFVEVLLIPISLNSGRNGVPIFPTTQILSRHVSNVNDRVWFY